MSTEGSKVTGEGAAANQRSSDGRSRRAEESRRSEPTGWPERQTERSSLTMRANAEEISWVVTANAEEGSLAAYADAYEDYPSEAIEQSGQTERRRGLDGALWTGERQM